MSLRRPLPRRLKVGASGLGLFAASVLFGPWLLGAPPSADATHGALCPPLTRLAYVELIDGRILAGPDLRESADTLVLSGRFGTRTLDRASVRRQWAARAWFGTDRYGRDLLRLMVRGGRLSLAVALLGVLVSLIVGLSAGLAAASGGPVLDQILMRFVDGLMAFPSLLLLILCAAVIEPGPATLILVLGLTSWMGLARLARGQVLSVRERPFVMAARVAGTPWYRTWLWHYFPEIRGPIAQDLALRMGDLILAEATLSYLGLGLPPTVPTWGLLVAQGHRVMLDAWWPVTIPGLAIGALVVCFALIGDGIQEL